MEIITIGKISVNAEYLRTISLAEAREQLPHIKSDVLKALWNTANKKSKKVKANQ
jgi:hypothetical protein